MAETIFFISRLKPGVQAADYEAWVEAVDYPRVRTYAAILEYAVMRVERGLRAERPDFDYVERVVVTDVDSYQQERLTKPGREEFLQQIGSYVESTHQFVVSTVGQGAKP